METTNEVASPPPKKCELTKVLPKPLIELIKAAPENEVARTQVLAFILKPLPAEAKTFEAIKQWIEANVDGEGLPNMAYVPRYEPPTPRRLPAANPNSITFPVECEDYEYGSARYSVSRYGTGQYELTLERIQELAEDRTMHELCESVREELSYLANDEHPDMEWGDNCEETDHESRGHEDFNANPPNRSTVRARLTEFLARTNPTLLRRLNGAGEPRLGEDEVAF